MSVRTVSVVLADAAAAAGFAPSIHNTQPWRWRVRGNRLDLYADRSRQLQVTDPEARMLTVSCGAALHHAQVALAADGWSMHVSLLPDPDDADHLATITVGERAGAVPDAARRLETIRTRHTDRRPVSDTAVGSDALERIRQAAASVDGVDVHILSSDQVIELASAAARADQVEVTDPQQRAELVYWVGGPRPEGVGIPDTALLQRPAQTIVPGRDFVRYGTLPAGQGHDRAARYAVLFGSGDDAVDWLRAGRSLSACWLTATEIGLSVLPFSAVVEIPATREVLRRTLSDIGYPYLVLRLGVPPPPDGQPQRTPRLPAEQIIDVE